jgi:hypothetical protein
VPRRAVYKALMKDGLISMEEESHLAPASHPPIHGSLQPALEPFTNSPRMFLSSLKRARIATAERHRRRLDTGSSLPSRPVANNDADSIDSIKREIESEFPTPSWPVGPKRWTFQVNVATGTLMLEQWSSESLIQCCFFTEAQKQAKKISDREKLIEEAKKRTGTTPPPPIKTKKTIFNEAAMQVTTYLGPYRVNGKVTTRYNTRTSNGLKDPLLVSRAIELYQRRLYHLVSTKGKAVLEDKTARNNIMKEASDIAIREAQALKGHDEMVGVDRRWVSISLRQRERDGAYFLYCNVPKSAQWQDGYQNVYFILSRYNGNPAPPFNSRTSWLKFGFNCNFLENVDQSSATIGSNETGSGSRNTTGSKTIGGVTVPTIFAAVNVMKQLINQTYHLRQDTDFCDAWKALREQYYKYVHAQSQRRV